MSSASPSPFQQALTWVVVLLAAVLLLLGVVLHGFSAEVYQRFGHDILGRVRGPMEFRFYLQPIMALIAAIPDGIADARNGHSAFFWTKRSDPTQRHGRLRQALVAIARVMLLGLSMDIIYQLKVFNSFYPVEALMMAILLALLPYFIFRWIVERVAHWRFDRACTAKGE